MILAPSPAHEEARLADVRALKILDTPPEQRYDEVVALAKHLFDVPIAYIAVIDADRQWFKAKRGLDVAQTPRDTSFCGHTILRSEPLVIPDALEDPRFADNPMVTGEPHVRFYAGHPLRGPGGQNVATLCLVDTQPRPFDEKDVQSLAHLATLAERQLKMVDVIGSQRELLEMQRRLEAELKDAEAYVRSFLPPKEVGLTATERPDYQFIASSSLGGDLLGFNALDDDHFSVYVLDVTGHGVGSSLLSVTVAQAIRNAKIWTDPYDPAKLLAALNDSFPMEKNQNKFITIWYGVYHRPTRRLTYASAGHHPALLVACPDHGGVNEAGDAWCELGEPALMLGAVPETSYTNLTHKLSPMQRLYVFSDGLFEVRNEEGRMLGMSGLRQAILDPFEQRGFTRVAEVIDRVRSYQGRADFDDDVSLLEVEFA